MPTKRSASTKAAEDVALDVAVASAASATSFDIVSASKLKVSDLKDQLEKLGLPSDGKKSDLIDRLALHYASLALKASAAASSTTTAPAKGRGKGKAAAVAVIAVPEPVPEPTPVPAESKRGGGRAKKAKVEPEAEVPIPAEISSSSSSSSSSSTTTSLAIIAAEEKKALKKSEILAAAAATSVSKAKPKVDEYFRAPGCQVYEDYACKLNQTNIGNNNNKYYIIQLLQDSNGNFHTFNRWGRVGEPGQNAPKPFGKSLSAAISDFEKKYKDKTGNNWGDRDSFVPKSGKYTQLAIDYDDDETDTVKLAVLNKMSVVPMKVKKIKQCTLPDPVQTLIKLIFDNDMFKNAMQNFEIDVHKMPLGKISKAGLATAYGILENIKEVLEGTGGQNQLVDLTNQFFTVIPHSFGRSRPPVINSKEFLQRKMEMLDVLGDIEIAQALLNKGGNAKSINAADEQEEVEEENPITVNYEKLKARLTPVEKDSQIFKTIQTYITNTKSDYSNPQLLHVFEVDRDFEADRFKAHKDIAHRKLLWHGTNVAVVAAILSSGLRIMPHSGGRVGKGIYFASEHAKSSGYVRPHSTGVAIMFLNEVALGKEHSITKDNSSLTKAPAGFDSIVARGTQEPDPSLDITIKIDNNDVIVPQGKAIKMPEYAGSSFHNSEYLVYKESQARIRYLLMLKM